MAKKKYGFLLITVLALFVMVFNVAASSAGIKVFVSGKPVAFDVPPYMEQGRTLVPLRAVGEALGAEVTWDEEQNKVTLVKNDDTVWLFIGQKKAYKNDQAFGLDVPAKLVRGRTMVPLRFIGNALGSAVEWQEKDKTVHISDLGLDMPLPPPPSDKSIFAYYAFNSLSSFQSKGMKVDMLSPAWYQIDRYGKITGQEVTGVLTRAKQQGQPVYALLQNLKDGNFSREEVQKLLSNPHSRTTAVNNIAKLLREKGYDGVNIDFEMLTSKDKDNFNSFVKELYERLNPAGFEVTLSVPAKESYYSNRAFDYAYLAKYADKIMVMVYDQHWFGGDPGPVAGYDWADRVLKYASSQIPQDKLFMGLGVYGYDWPKGSWGAYIKLKDTANLIQKYRVEIKWDVTAQSPYFTYTTGGKQHTVWFENGQSISAKLKLAEKYDVAGIAVWHLGLITDEIWQVIEAEF